MDSALLLLLPPLLLWALTGPVSPQTSGPCPERLPGRETRKTCPRSCRSDSDCGSKRLCLCDGRCGLSCVAPGRSCPWPLPPSETSESRLLSASPTFSALLEVRCRHGFTSPGGSEVAVRRCQGDRRWSGEEPVCREAQLPARACPLPAGVTDTFSVRGDASVGTSISYSCLSGAETVGTTENFCQENQTWRFPHPVCKKMFCRPPQEVERGYVVAVQKAEYEAGFDIHYLCRKGFLLDGAQRITCLSNGSWSASPPRCRARCVIPAERSRVVIGGVKR